MNVFVFNLFLNFVFFCIAATGPITWFDDNFEYILLPVEYVFGEGTKAYDRWRHGDYIVHLIPDLSDSVENSWIEIGINTFYNAEMREL